HCRGGLVMTFAGVPVLPASCANAAPLVNVAAPATPAVPVNIVRRDINRRRTICVIAPPGLQFGSIVDRRIRRGNHRPCDPRAMRRRKTMASISAAGSTYAACYSSLETIKERDSDGV